MSTPETVYATFVGGIDPAALQRLFHGISAAANNNVNSIHLLFQSTGGTVSDGVCLYNYFRALPIELCLYNTGAISSIATIAFLGAKGRKTSAHATFMIHRTYISPMQANVERLQSAAQSILIDDQRIEEILRAHVNLPADKWELHKMVDVTFTAKEAVEYGFADEIAEFQPLAGSQIFNV